MVSGMFHDIHFRMCIHAVLDALGYFLSGPLYSLGWICWALPWCIVVAMAWSSRCHPRCRTWNDFVTGRHDYLGSATPI